MRSLDSFNKIYFYSQPIDFRKQIRSLQCLITHGLGLDSHRSAALFVFINKRKTAVKCIYFDHNGFALWHKLLDSDKFSWPKLEKSETLVLTWRQFENFLLCESFDSFGIDIDDLPLVSVDDLLFDDENRSDFF